MAQMAKSNLIRVGVESPTDGLHNIFFPEIFDIHILDRHVKNFPELDLIAFSGGADINPKLYNQKPCAGTRWSDERDDFSISLHEHYASLPKVGICRGAQFLHVRNGGSLWQDIPNHNGAHHSVQMIDSSRQTTVTSVHHQACKPNKNVRVLAYSTESVTNTRDDSGLYLVPSKILEMFFIPEDNAFCCQFHPEYGHNPSKLLFFEYFWKLFPQLFKKSVKVA